MHARPEARWPDKVLFSAEKSGALRARAASRLWPAGQGGGTALVAPEGLGCFWRRKGPAGEAGPFRFSYGKRIYC